VHQAIDESTQNKNIVKLTMGPKLNVLQTKMNLDKQHQLSLKIDKNSNINTNMRMGTSHKIRYNQH